MKPTKEQEQAAASVTSDLYGQGSEVICRAVAKLIAKREAKVRKDCERAWGAIALREREQVDKAKAEVDKAKAEVDKAKAELEGLRGAVEELRVAGQELAESYQELSRKHNQLLETWMKSAGVHRLLKKDCVDCRDGSCDACMSGG